MAVKKEVSSRGVKRFTPRGCEHEKVLVRLVYQFLQQKKVSALGLVRLKKEFCRLTGGPMPKNSAILRAYRQLVREGRVRTSKRLEELLRLKKIRTLSGVAPVAVLTKPYPCPGECVYCPTEKGVPKSYLSEEPAVERAKRAGFDPFLQVRERIRQYEETGHRPEKIELIVIGGSFSWLPERYKRWFIKRSFEACNGKKAKSLPQAQRQNEEAKYRIVGMTLETRPDMVTPKEVKLMRQLGGTRVEIGVQSLNEQVLQLIRRGHGVEEVRRATRLLKDAGFKVCYHMMPNLPGSSLEKDEAVFRQLWEDEAFKPDMLKIYPCVVVKEAELYNWYKEGKHLPYSDEELIRLLIRIKRRLPRWVRLNRLVRDIPKQYIVGGTKISNLRQVVAERMRKRGWRCQCVRCREIRGERPAERLSLRVTRYRASGGQEWFLEWVDKDDRLYALLRLRLVKENKMAQLFPVLQGAALIRELHVFGRALGVKEKGEGVQHRGLGEQLLKKAEEIAKREGFLKVAVIAGVGVRSYYRQRGYQLKQSYMVKLLNNG